MNYNIEFPKINFKEFRRDEYTKWIYCLANVQGGVLYIQDIEAVYKNTHMFCIRLVPNIFESKIEYTE